LTPPHKSLAREMFPARLPPPEHPVSPALGTQTLLPVAAVSPSPDPDETSPDLGPELRDYDETRPDLSQALRGPDETSPNLGPGLRDIDETSPDLGQGLGLGLLEALAADPDVAAAAARAHADEKRAGGRSSRRGRHAAPPPPYLQRRAARFLIFSAIGGFVFLLGLGLQILLTGSWHMAPVLSYAVQAVVSVWTSFLLNRWLTWRDRNLSFWLAFARFNVQKTVTIALNLALYTGLLRLGVNYLAANVLLTAAFTIVNYVAGDRLVFIPGRTQMTVPAAPVLATAAQEREKPDVSVVIPCRASHSTIGATVQSLLAQDYPHLREITLIGSPGDSTWTALAGLADPRVSFWEIETPAGMRDANFKRDAAIKMASSDVVALVDSDIVLPHDWMSRAVADLQESGADCVTGGMKSSHDSFWGRYTDSTWIGAKTPRINDSYTVTSSNFGTHGRKPPISANVLFTRELYEHCPIDRMWSHGSYEDYEWFWRVVREGHRIRVCQDLFGWHHHRRGLRELIREYRRSSRGCAYFIRAHMHSPLAQRRLRQAVTLPLLAATGAAAAATASAFGYGPVVGGVILCCAAVLAVHQLVRSRSLESVFYPVAGLLLGAVFTAGLVTNLVRAASADAVDPLAEIPSQKQARIPADRPRWRLLNPLTAVCVVQAALSLTLVWSNTAYTDEASYLWAGRLEIMHWLHGTSWPSLDAYQTFPGSPVLYPPIGALASQLGGLAAARILSLVFMLGATILLYFTASKLIGGTAALFAAALWAFSEPVLRLAFATVDPLSILLTALSAWLVVQVSHRRHRGELIAAAAISLALANVTAYSGIAISPVAIAFAFLALRMRLPKHQAVSCAAWFGGTWLLSVLLVMTASHSWSGLAQTVAAPNGSSYQSVGFVTDEIWRYSALIFSLAFIGVLVTLRTANRNHVALIGSSCFTFFLLTQFWDQTSSAIDKHLSYGIWYAAIVAGYACSKLIRQLPRNRKSLTAICCAAAFIYPIAVSWQTAWQRYHSWPNSSEFINKFAPIAATARGDLYLPGTEASIAEYYTKQGNDWERWNTLPLNSNRTPDELTAYYNSELQNRNYGVVVLFYSTTFESRKLPKDLLLLNSWKPAQYQTLLNAVGTNSGEPGLAAFTLALQKDYGNPEALGNYNTSNISGTHDYGIYAIWQKRAHA
jgi:putative flippase GtrA/glycosyltransferase involved in cell wall biosynthesis